ncbi:hypothetical protein AMECASPLE_022735 [Ameca splendens]|uniref:Uncharacterized protein n=1 Tax=Ameca splendens TaxID=208324 RepID=A0ABV0Y4H3_9TELE
MQPQNDSCPRTLAGFLAPDLAFRDPPGNPDETRSVNLPLAPQNLVCSLVCGSTAMAHLPACPLSQSFLPAAPVEQQRHQDTPLSSTAICQSWILRVYLPPQDFRIYLSHVQPKNQTVPPPISFLNKLFTLFYCVCNCRLHQSTLNRT